MAARRAGSIVSISSISGLRGAPRRSIYAATKAALDGMTRAIAMEYGPQGIRANSVAPGVVATAMWRENLAKPGVETAVLDLIRRAGSRRRRKWRTSSCSSRRTPRVRFTGEIISADGGMHSTINLWPKV
jgi:3-oxoacyl-[acyl-carrier protein] reductase